MTELMTDYEQNLITFYREELEFNDEKGRRNKLKQHKLRLSRMTEPELKQEWERVMEYQKDVRHKDYNTSWVEDWRYPSSLEPYNYDQDNYAYF